MDGVRRLTNHSSATYCAVLDGSGELHCAIGDMNIHNEITVDWVSESLAEELLFNNHYGFVVWQVSEFKEIICSAPLVCIDGNIPTDTIRYVCRVCSDAGVPGMCMCV